ncbi:hypothetical protein [Anaerosalibacter massiliensis]|uniref:Uncharacterized protein n=1 Tax=Anaerosalibacter massiliensis TaxID=1347392 RepID=A0A9X2MJ52_9FIRM|nr:hypothetical protein [Anaerosalibacter massiliensis]MCR2044483.1 hypothetical protein [Anaerosalibacter massiliensis]
MMGKFKEKLGEEINIGSISNDELMAALDQIGRDLIYNYFLYGEDVSHEVFIENLKRYLELNKYF